MLWWCKVLFLVSTLISEGTSGHLVKEFTSADQEEARSMDLNKGSTSVERSNINLDSVLCEKYSDWSKWSSCTRKCDQTRVRRCSKPEECGRSWVKEKRTCSRKKGTCVPLSYKHVSNQVIGMPKRNRMIEELLYDLLYNQWTPWGPCTRSCRQKRKRQCKYKAVCVRSYIQEERRCQVVGSKCEHRFSLKPMHLIETENVDYGEHYEGKEEDEIDDGDDDNILFGEVDEDSEDVDDEGEPITNPFSPSEENGRDKNRPSRKNERKGTALGEEVTSAQKECGIRPQRTAGSYRVVGGQEVQKNSWPWQVAILTKYQEQYCGGTLIAPRWVLTAAHCVRKKGKRRRLMVRVGEHDIDEFDTTQEEIRPEKEFPHPHFDYHTITNDIALIKLRHAPSAFTRPGYACLPSADFTPPRDQLCTIVGWGKLKNTHIYGSDSLQEAQVPVVRHKKCQRVFDYIITSMQVCAGYKRGGKDSCAGDSGGPLLCSETRNGTDRYSLYGVTSYGEGCGRKGKYGIYTKVTSYLDWIYKTISENR